MHSPESAETQHAHNHSVKEKSVSFKSMLASKNLQKPIRTTAEGNHWIRVLAAELALRLNDARKVNPTLWPKSIVLHARQGNQIHKFPVYPVLGLHRI